MKTGKLPAELLSRLLATLPTHASVLIGPGIGRDAAAVDLGGGRVFVAKSDPVTFATDRIGRYAVNVNANDVACMGARPAYFLATVLLPDGARVALAESIFQDIRMACEALGIVCIGGHIEVTLDLKRPIVAGTMLGETTVEELVRPEDARAGDHIVMTKGIAIEGTALLARDAPAALAERGVSTPIIEGAAALLNDPGISVVTEAMQACKLVVDGQRAVHAMHDPTEGGLATALYEMGAATGLAPLIRIDDVPVLSETRDISEKLSIDPFGLLASGSLLIAVSASACAELCESIESLDIRSTCIGDLAGADSGAIIDRLGQRAIPRFERDELARFLDDLSAGVGE